MSRSQTADVLVLNISDFGEGHRNIDFLVKDSPQQILRATFFGAAKTKKHTRPSKFQTGRVWLYFNPIKDTYKVTDFEAKVLRSEISENLLRIWCASFLSELSLKMHGNIDWVLANAFLDGINRSSEDECKTALLRFIWRILLFAGVAPDFENCSVCGSDITASQLYYAVNLKEPVCLDCVKPSDANFKLSSEAVLYLLSVRDKPPVVSRNMQLSHQAFCQLKAFLFFMIQEKTGQKLKTLESGIL